MQNCVCTTQMVHWEYASPYDQRGWQPFDCEELRASASTLWRQQLAGRTCPATEGSGKAVSKGTVVW